MVDGPVSNGHASPAKAEQGIIIAASSSSSSGLSPVPNAQADAKSSEPKKRPRDSNGSTASKAPKKPKAVVREGEGEQALRGVYCHQYVASSPDSAFPLIAQVPAQMLG